MTLRDELQSAIDDLTERESLKGNPEATERRKQLNESSNETHKELCQQLQVIAKVMPAVEVESGCYVMGIQSKCLHIWPDGRFIALTGNGQLVSVYKDAKKAKRSKGRIEAVMNIRSKDLTPLNFDEFFGPLLDWEPPIADS